MTKNANQHVVCSKFKRTEISTSISGSMDLSREIVIASGERIEIASVITGIDTLKTLFAKKLPKEAFAALKASTAFGKINVRMHPMKVLKQWEVLISWHQPTQETYYLLAKYPSEQMMIVRFDLCLDLITTTQVKALVTSDYVIRHLCPPYTRGEPTISGSVFYMNPRSAQTNFAIYGDRTSKFCPSSSCAHIERRLQTAAATRKVIKNSTTAISTLNHTDFWSKNLRMIEPRLKSSWDMTDAFINRNPRALDNLKSRWYPDARSRLRQLIKRGYTLESMTGSGEELIPAVTAWAWERDVLRKKKPVLIDNTAFLPSHVICYLKHEEHD